MSNLTIFKTVWPSAARGWDLLHGAGILSVQDDGLPATHESTADRNKRSADHAFGHGRQALDSHETFGTRTNHESGQGTYYGNGRIAGSGRGEREAGSTIMDHMLGLAPSGEGTPYNYQGYEWWPRSFVAEGQSVIGSSHDLSPEGEKQHAPTNLQKVSSMSRGSASYGWVPMPGYSFNFSNYGYE
jgi:hypothetical protein